jgi:hypothetical protein
MYLFFRLSMLLCSREARPQAETYAPCPPPPRAAGSVRTRCQCPRPNTAAFGASYCTQVPSHERALQHTRLVEEFMLRSEFSGQMDDFAKMKGASPDVAALVLRSPSLFVLMMSADVIHHVRLCSEQCEPLLRRPLGRPNLLGSGFAGASFRTRAAPRPAAPTLGVTVSTERPASTDQPGRRQRAGSIAALRHAGLAEHSSASHTSVSTARRTRMFC